MRSFLLIAGFTIFCLLLIILGWASNEVYRAYSNHRDINGLWFRPMNFTRGEVVEYAKQMDTYGEWVCVNIKGMTVKEIIKTCEHEASHEAFAEYCENKPLECLETIKNYDEFNSR
jgi:hypothetical protein